jgi:hypothetical protein
MKRIKNLLMATGVVACGVAALGIILTPSVKGDAWNKKTIVTVNEPIIAGNKVLEPGTYVWKLLDSPSDRHIVQIFNKDENKVETTILAIPNYRLQPLDKSQFTFWETPDGVPKAVRAWFYPGDNFGQEFAYPKKLVAQLAAARPVPVPVEYAPPPAPEPAPVPAPAPEPTAEPAPAPAPEPTPAPEPAPAPQPQAQEPAPAPAAPAALPKTASPYPLIGLLGLLSLGASAAFSIAAKRS